MTEEQPQGAGAGRQWAAMKTGRVESLTDGIYAIAMTILVLNLEVPEVPAKTADVIAGLLRQGPQFFDFVISFFLLAVFWTIHHRHFEVIVRADARLLWINVTSLMLVVLIPFSTSFFGAYRNVIPAAVLLELNIFLIGVMKYTQWRYVTTGRRLVGQDLSDKDIQSGLRINLVTPIVSLAAMAVALVSPDWSTSLYMSVPFIVMRLRQT